MKKSILATAIFLTLWSFTFSQIQTIYVKPVQTDTKYSANQDPHMVIRNSGARLNKLFLFIPGSQSITDEYQAVCNFAANLGYDVLNISYPNKTAVVLLAQSKDSLVYDKFRQELCYGTPLSNDVNIDTLNSIYTRTVNLLNYLNKKYPAQHWSQYLINSKTPDWTKITVGGHSQGGGHACYFGKHHPVERVLMFSSPNDYNRYFSKSAGWLSAAGITPLNKQYVYLNLMDEVAPFPEQFQNMKALGLSPAYDTTNVNNYAAPYKHSHLLYATHTAESIYKFHKSTAGFNVLNYPVWYYMFMEPTIMQ
jgi:hypothetical protein